MKKQRSFIGLGWKGAYVVFEPGHRAKQGNPLFNLSTRSKVVTFTSKKNQEFKDVLGMI